MCKLFVKLSACPAKDAKCEELDFGDDLYPVLGASLNVLFKLARREWKV